MSDPQESVLLSGGKGERKEVEHVALGPEELHEIITRQNSFFFLLLSTASLPSCYRVILLPCHLATVSSCKTLTSCNFFFGLLLPLIFLVLVHVFYSFCSFLHQLPAHAEHGE